VLLGIGVAGAVVAMTMWPRMDPKIEAQIKAGEKRYKEAYPTRASRRAREIEIAGIQKEWREKGWRPGQPIPK